MLLTVQIMAPLNDDDYSKRLRSFVFKIVRCYNYNPIKKIS